MNEEKLGADPQPIFSPSLSKWEANPWDSNVWMFSCKTAFNGLFAHGFHNIINSKALLTNPGYFVIYGVLGYMAGFPIHKYKKDRMLETEKLRDKLVMRRMMRLKRENAHAGQH